jgi:hypothetical protein
MLPYSCADSVEMIAVIKQGQTDTGATQKGHQSQPLFNSSSQRASCS